MKNIKFVFILITILAVGFTYSSCDSKAKNKDTIEKQGKEYTSAYVCPMHCTGSGSDKVGTCPVCSMDYEKNENYEPHGHKHDEDSHDGHNH
ncbi:MAG: heavy metal-binding domain-containing protein [Saprospiraceae bacterium]